MAKAGSLPEGSWTGNTDGGKKKMRSRSLLMAVFVLVMVALPAAASEQYSAHLLVIDSATFDDSLLTPVTSAEALLQALKDADPGLEVVAQLDLAGLMIDSHVSSSEGSASLVLSLGTAEGSDVWVSYSDHYEWVSALSTHRSFDGGSDGVLTPGTPMRFGTVSNWERLIDNDGEVFASCEEHVHEILLVLPASG
jgi:hypothetical protein